MERRSVADRAADREVARALRARGGAATVADVEVATALPQATAERALARLLDGHDGSVGVAKGGALIYRFTVGPFGLKARRERRVLLRHALHAVAAVAATTVTALRAVFRAALAIQLLVYMMAILAPVSVIVGVVVGIVLFVVMIIAAIGDGDVSGLFDLVTSPTLMGILLAGCVIYGTYLVFKRKMDLLMALAGKDERGKQGLAGFIAQVNDFALGPEKPPTRAERIDRAWTVAQDDERLVLERVRARGGRLRAGDLVEWLGLGLDEADRQATRICVEHDGEPAAADIDVVEFELSSLLATTDAKPEGGKTRHERGVRLPRLTANSAKEDATIAAFAVVNGLAGAIGWSQLAGRHGGWWHAAWIAGGALPVGFTAVIFGLLLLRVPGFLVVRALRSRAQRRAAILDAIVSHCRGKKRDRPIDLEPLGAHADTRRAALALQGSFDLDDADPPKTVWRFPRLTRELSAPRARGGEVEKVTELDG